MSSRDIAGEALRGAKRKYRTRLRGAYDTAHVVQVACDSMRTLCAFIALIMSASIVGCAAHRKAPSRAIDYFPLAVGNAWTYRTGPRVSEYTNSVTDTRSIDGVTTYAMVIHNTYSFIAKTK